MRRALPALVVGLAVSPPAHALSVEALVGDDRASIDTMFFKYFPTVKPDGSSAPSAFLLFQRVRGSFGYDPADPLDAASFGITTAVSWNPAVLHGVAPVLVGQILSAGPIAKAGVQYANVGKRATVFGWVVSELGATPGIDGFVLGRYRWSLGGRTGVAAGVEGGVTVPTGPEDPFSVTERARLGVCLDAWQVGPGVDVAEYGRGTLLTTLNLGGFVRHEF